MIHTVVFLFKFVLVIALFASSILRVRSFPLLLLEGAPQQNHHRNHHYASQSQLSLQMSLTSPTQDSSKEYAPSQYVVDEATGEKWRLCAGAAVLNSRNEVLVGERIGRPDNWQCPQGGVDDAWTPRGESNARRKETILEACTRELHEELGLESGRQVVLDQSFPLLEGNSGVRYSTSGTSSWLTKAGFSGQELHWTIYRIVDGRGDTAATVMCDLSGKGGESAEFSNVKWMSIEGVEHGIWEPKRAPYTALKSMIESSIGAWKAGVESIDFSGKWSRDNSLSTGVVEGLKQRGLSEEEAKTEAGKPYIQSWKRDEEESESWHVTTYEIDGSTARRTLEYRPGKWVETYKGKATLFGGSDKVCTLERQTSYVAEPDARPIAIAQVTITTGPKGMEESRRYLKDDQFVLRRTLWPLKAPDRQVVSVEKFTQSA